MTANQIAYQKLVEEGRANRARELETNRSNRANEGLKSRELSELERHQATVEGETNRANVAKETENERANRAREGETLRSNQMHEYLQRRAQSETERANLANESLKSDSNDITRVNNLLSSDLRRDELNESKRKTTIQGVNQLYEGAQNRKASMVSGLLSGANNIAAQGIRAAGQLFTRLIPSGGIR